MAEEARNMSDVDDSTEKFFCTEFCLVIHNMEFQFAQSTWFNYTVTPVTASHAHFLHTLIITMTRFLQMCVGFAGMRLSQIR